MAHRYGNANPPAREPEVTCITKNKSGKPYEYGIKVSHAVDAPGMVVTQAKSPDNRHGATTRKEALDG
jgi:IS5 family transposase